MSLSNLKNLRLWLFISILVGVIGYFYLPSPTTLKLYAQYYRPLCKRKMIVMHNGGFGERETIARLKIVANKQKIGMHVFEAKTSIPTEAAQIENFVNRVISIFKPNFVLILEDTVTTKYQGVANYLSLTRGGNNRYITTDSNGNFVLTYPHMNKADGLLTAFDNTNLLEQAYTQQGKYFIFRWHPTGYATDYTPAIPRKLFYSGGHLWDKTRASDKYLELFKQLDKTGYFVVCGVPKVWQHTPNSLMGQLPFDGKSVIENIHKAGVSLLLHTNEHIKGEAPTSRIFEAAGANAVIISDRHPFIEKYFGANVLYVDTNQNAKNLFQQIDAHMQWILNNPGKAQQLAQNCNNIFKEKFLLEDQLNNLFKFHAQTQNYNRFVEDILPSNKIKIKEMPKDLQTLLIQQNLPSLSALVQIKNNKIKYYFDKPTSYINCMHWLKKLYAIASQLEKITKSSKIPDGAYLFSLEDGIHKPFPCKILSFAADRELVVNGNVILIPDHEALQGYDKLFAAIDNAKNKNPWSRKISKIFWRGQSSGLYFQAAQNKPFPRLKFMTIATHKEYIDAGFTQYNLTMPKTLLNNIRQKFKLKPFVTPEESLRYKYLLDIDGHSCSYSRMAWILASNSLLVKHQSNKIQWYYDRLEPYVHYLPIDSDFSDLDNKFLFAENHPLEVKNMIQNAQLLAQEVFNAEEISKSLHNALVKYNLETTDKL